MKTVKVPMEWLNEARRTHYFCEDCWYSCPKSDDGCCDDQKGDECNCGADKWNAEIDALLAAAQQQDQRESNSNPSPSAGQSKQGLTSSHDGAPTTIKGWVISEAEQKLLDEYAACFAEPTDAPTHTQQVIPPAYLSRVREMQKPSDAWRMAEDLYNRLCSLGKDRYLLISQDEAEKCIAALRAKEKR